MTPEELTVHRANSFLCDLDMGGWDYNFLPTPEEPAGGGRMRDAAAALHEIGGRTAAAALRRVADLLDPVCRDPNRPGDLTLGEIRRIADPGGEIEQLADRLEAEAHDPPQGTGFWEKLTEFTSARLGCSPD